MKAWIVGLAAGLWMTGLSLAQAPAPAYRSDPYYLRAAQLYQAAATLKAQMEADPRCASDPLLLRRLEQTAREAARLFLVLQRRHPAQAAFFRARAEEAARTSRAALDRLVQLLGAGGRHDLLPPAEREAAAQALPALSKHRAAYREAVADVEREHANYIRPIERQYRSLLDSLLTRAGKFNDPVLAGEVRKELLRLTRTGGAPGAPSDAPEVRELQTGYARERAPLDEGRRRRLRELAGGYDRLLEQMEQELAQKKKTRERTLVQMERRDLARRLEASLQR